MRIKKLLPLLLVLSLAMANEPTNRSDGKMSEQLFKSMYPSFGIVEHVLWDGNKISTVHGNHGDVSSYHITGNSGTEWPKGSGKMAIFQSGIWLASGKTRPAGSDQWVDEIRTAAAEYTVEFVPGTIDETTNLGHIYEIHRVELDAFLENDYATYSAMSAALPRTVIDGSEIKTEPVEKSFPTRDFETWPVDAGAPWVDVNGDGVYNIEDGDHPDILGDMFHWYVMNDGDPGTHTALWGTPPMNAEVQTSLFGFDQSGPLGNILFVRWMIINKGADDLDSMFVSMWHDDDVGDASDDLVGCDTVLSVGYTYNDIDGDGTYGVEVPAVGADFFQGPLVDSPDDTARILTWSLENSYHIKTIPGKRDLGLTSFAKYCNGCQTGNDPNTAEEAYIYMNGMNGTKNEPFINTETGKPSVFVHSGDPVSGSGWVDDAPGDRRYLMSSGPFYFGSGDTVEVVGSIIIAAGSNWAKSITIMKYFDNFAQGAFDANFNVCSPPSVNVEVSQLDQKVILSFEDDSDKIEEYNCLGYEFQGYNIYQGESATGPWHRITTYDIVDDIKIILDQVLDENTGELLEVPVQFGTDSYLSHYIEITDDIVGNRTLINYRKYYFAVTAYAYDSEAAQRVIESPIKSVEAVPGVLGVGSGLKATYADTISANHVAGEADAVFSAAVVAPYMLTGHSYSVTFEQLDADNTVWHLVDEDENDSLLINQASFPVDDPITITDGFILQWKGASFSAPTDATSSEFGGDTDTSTTVQLLGLGNPSIDGKTWPDFLQSLHEAFGIQAPSGWPAADELKLDLEVRFTANGSVGSYFNTMLTVVDTVSLPFEIWSIDGGQERQINTSIYQVTGFKPVFQAISGTDGYQLTGDLYIMPVFTDYDPAQTYHFADDADKIGWIIRLDKGNSIWENGNFYKFLFENPLKTDDKYTFEAVGLQPAEASDIKEQLEKINVFPNPYFGQNPEERTPQDRKVFFIHLGVGRTTIRIFTLSGDLVTKVIKDIDEENSPGNRAEWDLRNQNGIPVASGMYLAHITVEDENGKKIGERLLKLAIFQPEERLDLF